VFVSICLNGLTLYAIDYRLFYIFVYTYTCNDMRSVMLQINEYDADDET